MTTLEPPTQELSSRERSEAIGALISLIGGVLLAAIVALLCSAAHVAGEVSAQLTTIAGVLPEAGFILHRLRRRKLRRSVPAISRGEVYHPGPMVAVLFGVALFLVETVSGGVVGWVAGEALTRSGGDPALLNAAMMPGQILITTPLILIAALLLARRAAHHLRAPRMPWIAAGLGIWFGLRVLTIMLLGGVVGLGPVLPLLLDKVILLAVMLLLGWAGCAWARRTQAVHTARTLFSKLAPEQREEALAEFARLVSPPVEQINER